MSGSIRRYSASIAIVSAISLLTACSSQQGAGAAPHPVSDEVNIGYGTTARENVTGAVSSIREEDVASRRATRIDELLQTVPGVEVLRRGGSFSVRIRGAGSLHGSSDPLFVLDGVPVAYPEGMLLGLSPSDVARIDVLKDAGSTAIYGSRGANGVILITTKRAR